ncbi:MAG: class I SAM-dependent methyltransferase [Alphaproteobacteria bacterium]|nr:class I SAM-dependent methyltransferase [Alphaproteobacteria bacterium]
MLWEAFTKRFRHGHLTVLGPGRRAHRIGDGEGPEIVIGVRDWATLLRIALNPELRFGEAYVDGGIVFEAGDLADFFALYERNREAAPPQPGRLARLVLPLRRRWQQANDRRRSRANVAHHYDLSEWLYRLFLDREMYYSCAYFAHPGMTLEEAQAAKARHIAAKLLLRPGQSVLDIGSGWGSLALALAADAGVSVTGVTLSAEQLGVARRSATARGLADQVVFELKDYRDVAARFDRIVSVGMFEHVGAPNFDRFFAAVRARLADDGVALVHSIGRHDPPGTTNPWMRKYIFPGGYVPALSETLAAVERAGLWVTDVEILRLHYAETCRHWRARFLARAGEACRLYDERFVRMWDFYLAASEAGFRYGDLMVFQLQLSRRVDAVPVTRDYIAAAEAAQAPRPTRRSGRAR